MPTFIVRPADEAEYVVDVPDDVSVALGEVFEFGVAGDGPWYITRRSILPIGPRGEYLDGELWLDRVPPITVKLAEAGGPILPDEYAE